VKPNLKPVHPVVEPVSLTESLGLGTREVISLVGAGGKTTLMFRLAKELVHIGKKVVTTTTTKILEPSPEESRYVFVNSENERIKKFVGEQLSFYRNITIAQERLESGKLKGLSPASITELWNSEQIEYLIVEADGAAGHPVKAPREEEPVIPSDTTLVVALSGVDGMDLVLKEENIFRSEQVSRLTGLPLGSRMTDEAMALVITHPDGIFRGAPISSRVIVFLNKVDIPNGMEKARSIAKKILNQRHRQIERILLGRLRGDPPVVEVLFQHHQF
jgi:probable selenium-dependent hydroxylase accessory protein YqeC